MFVDFLRSVNMGGSCEWEKRKGCLHLCVRQGLLSSGLLHGGAEYFDLINNFRVVTMSACVSTKFNVREKLPECQINHWNLLASVNEPQ